MTAVLLKNGTVIDGTGGAALGTDVLISNGTIAAVGQCEPQPDWELIDCSGLTVAPGFIDIHSHSDVEILNGRREKTLQGVTTEVVGNCGFSPYPTGGRAGELREFAGPILCGDCSDEPRSGRQGGHGTWGWDRARSYLDAVGPMIVGPRVLSMVGHGSLRIAVAGPKQGPLDRIESERLELLLDEALTDGAAGLSTGLMYAPGSSAPREELLALCRVVARRGKVYASHIRSYSWDLLPAIREQIGLARESGCRLEISHLQAAGRANWTLLEPALEMIDRARGEGLDVAFDMYPYLAGCTVISQFLPQWALDGGASALVGRLCDPGTRAQIARHVRQRTAQSWSDIFVASASNPRQKTMVGGSIAQLAEAASSDPVELFLSLALESRGEMTILAFNQSEENLRRILTHSLCVVASDGFYVKGRPHPRLAGTFPFFVGEISRNRKWLSLTEAVWMITGKAADRFELRDRGRIAPGALADITVFDAGTIAGPADYEHPSRPPEGISLVLREGRKQFASSRNLA